VNVRAYEARDRKALRSFACGNGQRASYELEQFLRRGKVAGWLRSTRGAEAWVLETDGGDIVGIVLTQPSDDPPVDEEELECDQWWFVSLVAISAELQGRELGPDLLDTVLEELSTRQSVGMAYWKVAVENTYCHVMSEAVGAAPDPAPPSAGLLTYIVEL
jgi:ribosomal protein S18 acetylase RimI-like enzyme